MLSECSAYIEVGNNSVSFDGSLSYVEDLVVHGDPKIYDETHDADQIPDRTRTFGVCMPEILIQNLFPHQPNEIQIERPSIADQ